MKREGSRPVPGVIVVWSGERPTFLPLPVPDDGLLLGREMLGPSGTDDRISRKHARVRCYGPGFSITDLGSRNGTYAAGQPIVDREISVIPPCVLRTGRTVSVVVADLHSFEGHEVHLTENGIWGPSTARQMAVTSRAAIDGANLTIIGEAGTGKHTLARMYCEQRGGPYLVLPAGATTLPALSEDVRTLVIETPLPVTLQVALRPLLRKRNPIAVVTLSTGSFSAHSLLDPALPPLLGRCTVTLPPLRERPDVLPYLISAMVSTRHPEIAVHSTLVESCLLRPWPGNLRELHEEMRRATRAATGGETGELRAIDLEDGAGHIVAEGSTGSFPRVPTGEFQQRRRRPRVTKVD
jgi:hypothetical protein